MGDFNLGDRVRLPSWWGGGGELGTVCEEGNYSIGVRVDTPSAACHNCAGSCEEGYGWYFAPSEIELIVPAKRLSKEELICNKVKYLKEKFDTRKGVQST